MNELPHMNEIVTVHVNEGAQYFPESTDGHILFIVPCEDGDVYIIRLPDGYWRRD